MKVHHVTAEELTRRADTLAVELRRGRDVLLRHVIFGVTRRFRPDPHGPWWGKRGEGDWQYLGITAGYALDRLNEIYDSVES